MWGASGHASESCSVVLICETCLAVSCHPEGRVLIEILDAFLVA